MKMNNFLLLFAILFLNGTCKDKCEGCHDTIMFKNATDKSVYVMRIFYYPDTLSFKYFPSPLLDPNFRRVLPNTNDARVLRNMTGGHVDYWENTFNDNQTIPSDTLMVFVFDEEVLKNNIWEDVGTNYMVLQRYDLSLHDLQELNWQISYPPSEAMRYIKMYPPYESK